MKIALWTIIAAVGLALAACGGITTTARLERRGPARRVGGSGHSGRTAQFGSD